MKCGTQNHPKFKLLKSRLGLTDWQVIGILESIWQLTATAAWEGDIGKFDDELIAASIEWQDDPSELITALVDSGWIDRVDDDRRLIVHDWPDHCPEYIRKRFQRQTASDGVRQRQTASANGRQRRINHTKPNPTQPSQESKSADAGLSSDESDVVESWNSISGVTHARQLTDKRRRALHNRLKDPEWREAWPDAIDKVRSSAFLRGENARGWKPDLTWFLKPDTVTEILEGKFDDGSASKNVKPKPISAGVSLPGDFDD